jgi:hypothetical protein
MLIHVFTDGCDVCAVPKAALESRAWLASQRAAAGRVSWVGVRLTCTHVSPSDAAAPRVATCRIDAWLRGGGGLVSVRHADADAWAAVDRAAVRLERALARRPRATAAAAAAESPRGRAKGRGSDDYWHAEWRWEDDGGRVRSAGHRLKRRAAGAAAASGRVLSAHDVRRPGAIIRRVGPGPRTGRVRELART